jgi:nitrite reductase/ring-hydroxylating ferredoxin subunit
MNPIDVPGDRDIRSPRIEEEYPMQRRRVCAVSEMDDGDMRRIEAQPPIAIYRVKGQFFATAATCTHMESCLTEGYLDDDIVECALHGARFSVRDGRALSLPATRPLRTFPVQVAGGDVWVEVLDEDT